MEERSLHISTNASKLECGGGARPGPAVLVSRSRASDWLEVRQEFVSLPASTFSSSSSFSVEAAGARQPFAARKHTRVIAAGAAEDGAEGGERGETKKVATLLLCLCGAARFLPEHEKGEESGALTKYPRRSPRDRTRSHL